MTWCHSKGRWIHESSSWRNVYWGDCGRQAATVQTWRVANRSRRVRRRPEKLGRAGRTISEYDEDRRRFL